MQICACDDWILGVQEDGAVVSSDVLVKICKALDCTMDDIVEIVPDNQ